MADASVAHLSLTKASPLAALNASASCTSLASTLERVEAKVLAAFLLRSTACVNAAMPLAFAPSNARKTGRAARNAWGWLAIMVGSNNNLGTEKIFREQSS